MNDLSKELKDIEKQLKSFEGCAVRPTTVDEIQALKERAIEIYTQNPYIDLPNIEIPYYQIPVSKRCHITYRTV